MVFVWLVFDLVWFEGFFCLFFVWLFVFVCFYFGVLLGLRFEGKTAVLGVNFTILLLSLLFDSCCMTCKY